MQVVIPSWCRYIRINTAMGNTKKSTTSSSGKCQPVKMSIFSPARSRKKPSTRIGWSQYDEQAAETFAKIKAGEEGVVRQSTVIPESRYADVKGHIAYKRQSFQQYVWALILQDLDHYEKGNT